MRSIATENDTEEEMVINTAHRYAAFPQETILRRQIMTIGKRSDMVAKYLFLRYTSRKQLNADLTLPQMPDNPANPDEDEDPYNLEEFASQLIEDEHQGDPTSSDPSENISVSKEQEADLNNDAANKSNIKSVTHYEKLHSLQSEEPYLSDFEDLMRADMTGSNPCDKSAMESTKGSAAINQMSTEDFSSCEDDGNESEDLLSSFTRIKNKAGSMDHCSRTATESCEMIPPTASLKCGLDLNTANDLYPPEGEELSRSSEEQIESLSDEDSDEGLFTRSKEKRGKPKMVCARPSNCLREGRKRFRR